MQIISKISVKNVFGTLKVADIPETGEKMLMRVEGIVCGTKTGQSTFGEWLAFRGEFRATNMETGEIYRAQTCFLPEVAENIVLAAIPEEGNLEFAFDIGVKRNPTQREGEAVKHQYTVHPLIESRETDPFEVLSAKIPPLKLASPVVGMFDNDSVESAEKVSRKKSA